MDILTAMRMRKSVRSYIGTTLTPQLRSVLEAAASVSFSPFGGKADICLEKFGVKEDIRPSTYGVVRGTEDFFLIYFGDDRQSALTAGFRFEQVVLKATELGLGTCWMAGTFKNKTFGEFQRNNDGLDLKIVCPVGYAAKKRISDRVITYVMGSKARRPFAELFFGERFGMPLSENSECARAFEMMRIAPSSANSQPWRAVVDDRNSAVHFYCKSRGNISFVDCGIGLYHFYATLESENISCNFYEDADCPVPPEGVTYVVSATMKVRKS